MGDDTATWTFDTVQDIVVDVVCRNLGGISVQLTDNYLTHPNAVFVNPQCMIHELNRRFDLILPLKTTEEKCIVSDLVEEVYQAITVQKLPPPPLEEPFPRDQREFPLSHIQVECFFRYQLDDVAVSAVRQSISIIRPLISGLHHVNTQHRLQQLFQQQSLFRNIFFATRLGGDLLAEVQRQRPMSATVGYYCPHLCLQRHRQSATASVVLETSRPPIRFRLTQVVDEVAPQMELTMQKILADRQSLAHLADCAVGTKVLPSRPKLQYVDFAQWQANFDTIYSQRTKLMEWRERLDDVEEIQLPNDRAVGEFDVTRTSACERWLQSGPLERAKLLCRSTFSCDLHHLVLTVFYAQLDKIAQKANIAVALLASHKATMQEVAEVDGNFENIIFLPLRKSSRSLPELVEYVKNVYNKSIENQVSAQVLAKYSTKVQSKHVSENAFTKLLFSYTKNGQDRSTETYLPDATEFALEVNELPNQLLLRFRGASLMFPQTLACLADQFMKLFELILSHQETNPLCLDTTCRLPSLQRRILQLYTEPVAEDYPCGIGLTQCIQESTGQNPIDCGFVSGKQNLSFGELRRKCFKVTDYVKQRLMMLTGNTFVPGTLLGILGDETPEAYCGVLGAILAGSAYVPISVMDPAGRKQHILQDANLGAVFTKSGTEHEMPERTMCYVDSILKSPMSGRRTMRRRYETNGADIAYIIYTSGTTGVPKGVAVQQRSIIGHCVPYAKNSLVHRAMLQTTRFTFDPSVAQLVNGLLTGSTTVLPTNKTSSYDAMKSSKIVSFAQATPSVLLGMEQKLPKLVAKVESLGISGERIPHHLLASLTSHAISSYNMYGPTEATEIVTINPVRKSDPPSTIGQIVKGSAYVMDKFNQLVPVGHYGELTLLGDCVATGYLNSPEKTAQAFQVNPFQSKTDCLCRRYSRMYLTGDISKWYPDGDVICMGRVDQQIKLRGVRVELEEIECLLCTSPLVSAAAVIALYDKMGRPQNLAAAYVPTTVSYLPDEMTKQLKAWLGKSLAPFVVPAFYTALDALPTTAGSAKLDRRIVRKIIEDALANQQKTGSASLPNSHLELMLITLMSDVLKANDITPTSNFFASGGNSLLTLELRRRITDMFKVNVKVTDIFRNQTPQELADFIAVEVSEVTVCTTVSMNHEVVAGLGTAFCLHVLIGGAVFPYMPIFNERPWPGPVYGVDHPNVYGEQMPNSPFDAWELIDMYMKDMMASNAPQPQALIAFSLGGTIAYMINQKLPAEERMLTLSMDWDPFLSNGVREFMGYLGLIEVMHKALPQLDLNTTKQMAANGCELWTIFVENGPKEFPSIDYPVFNFIASDGLPEYLPKEFTDQEAYITELCVRWNRAAGRRVPYDVFPGNHHSINESKNCAKLSAKCQAILAELNALKRANVNIP